MKKFFTRHQVYVPDKELTSLVERYDKQLTGKITYNQFVSELAAKKIF